MTTETVMEQDYIVRSRGFTITGVRYGTIQAACVQLMINMSVRGEDCPEQIEVYLNPGETFQPDTPDMEHKAMVICQTTKPFRVFKLDSHCDPDDTSSHPVYN